MRGLIFMLYVLFTISASGNRHILYSSSDVDDVRAFYDNNIDCFATCSMYRFGVYVGCTEKPLFVLENEPYFDEKPYFYTLEGFYSMEKSDDDDDDDAFNDDFDDDFNDDFDDDDN
jgi:hypothetical protein